MSTVDPATGERLAEYPAFVDAVVASDVRTPFGGTRADGHGREPAATVPASESSRGET